MKKLLTILGAVGLTATTSATVVACGDKNENLSKMSVDELNNKLKNFIEIGKKLVKEAGDNPSEHSDIVEKKVQNAFAMYTFINKVFLETSYAVELTRDGDEEFNPIVKKADPDEYKKLLKETIDMFEKMLEEGDKDHQDYVDALTDQVAKLKEKFESLAK